MIINKNKIERKLDKVFNLNELEKYSSKNLIKKIIYTNDELDTYFNKYYVINYLLCVDPYINVEYFNYLKRKPFRLSGKKIILNYYPVFKTEKGEEEQNVLFENLEEAKDKILEKLKEKEKLPKIKQYIISKEKKETRGIQVYLEFNQQVNLGSRDEYYLDLKFNDKICRGIYQNVNKKEDLLNYIIKNTDFIADPPLMFLDGEYFLKLKDFLIALYYKEGMDSFKNYLIQNTEALLKGGTTLLKHFEKLEKKRKKELMHKPNKKSFIPIENFNIPYEIAAWFEKGCKEVLFIAGPSVTEKSMGVKSFLENRQISYLLIKNIEELSIYNLYKHQAILLDDHFFENLLKKEEYISLNEIESSSIIRILKDSFKFMVRNIRFFIKKRVHSISLSEVNKSQGLSRFLLLKIDKGLFFGNTEEIVLESNMRPANIDDLIVRNRKLLREWDQDKKNELEKRKKEYMNKERPLSIDITGIYIDKEY